MSKLADEIKQLIGDDELGEVFDILSEKVRSAQRKNDVLLQKAHWREKKRAQRNGTISVEEFDLAIQRVRKVLLEWIEEW